MTQSAGQTGVTRRVPGVRSEQFTITLRHFKSVISGVPLGSFKGSKLKPGALALDVYLKEVYVLPIT